MLLSPVRFYNVVKPLKAAKARQEKKGQICLRFFSFGGHLCLSSFFKIINGEKLSYAL